MASRKLDDLIRRREQLDAQIRDARVRQEKADRKARNHAMMVLGGMVEAATGGDWRKIDFASLDRAIYESGEKLAAATRPQPLETADATKALRDFEKWKRDTGTAKKSAASPAVAGDAADENGIEDEVPIAGWGGDSYARQANLF